MDFKTSTGGDTTLVFDEAEMLSINQQAKHLKVQPLHVMETLTRLRQAEPLATFEDLVRKLPATYGNPLTKRTAGVASVATQTPPIDPMADLEADIRRRLGALRGVGTTSGVQQTEAVLIQALATCLQTRALCRRLDVLVQPMVVLEQKE